MPAAKALIATGAPVWVSLAPSFVACWDGAWEKDEKLARSVRMAHCALADAQHAQDVAVLAGGKVTSESVGKWSRSIQQDDAQTGSFERRCLRIAAQYIPVRSGLLYRGASGC